MAIPAAQQLKDDGIIIISLGLESFVNKAQLESVATSQGHVVTPKSEGDASAISDLVSMICAGENTRVMLISRRKI